MERVKPSPKQPALQMGMDHKPTKPTKVQDKKHLGTVSQSTIPSPAPSKKISRAQKAPSTPWEYTPNVGSEVPVRPGPRSSEDADLFLDADLQMTPDWEIADQLLEDAAMCSQLFTRRVLQQKLAEPMELLAVKPTVEPLAKTLETLHQFLLENPNFFLDRFGDSGYLCFPGLIRSEVFELLDAITAQKHLALQQMAGYGPEEIHKSLLVLAQQADWIAQITGTALLVENALK